MKKMALGMRMGLGYGMLIVVALVLGGLAAWPFMIALQKQYFFEIQYRLCVTRGGQAIKVPCRRLCALRQPIEPNGRPD